MRGSIVHYISKNNSVWNVKKKKKKDFKILFLMQFLLLLENITFLVMIGNMVSMIKVWLILSLNLVVWF